MKGRRSKAPSSLLGLSLLAVGGPLLSDVGWVAHVLLLFNLIGLIGPLEIPPNDQLRGLARARLSFSESSWASRDGGMSNISVFAPFSRQIHTIVRPMRAAAAAAARQRRRRRCQTGSPLAACILHLLPPLCLSVSSSPRNARHGTRTAARGQGDKRRS